MDRLKRFVFFILPLLFSFYFLDLGAPWQVESRPKARPTEVQKTELKILKCNDGDTCKAQTSDGFQITLRLLGVDAPEVAKTSGPKKKRNSGQAFANEARDFTNQAVSQKKIRAEIYGSDAFRRYLAVLYPAQGSSLNQQMVEGGYAYAYRGKMKEHDLQKHFIGLEAQAQKGKKGLWALSQPPEDPAIFRKKNR